MKLITIDIMLVFAVLVFLVMNYHHYIARLAILVAVAGTMVVSISNMLIRIAGIG